MHGAALPAAALCVAAPRRSAHLQTLRAGSAFRCARGVVPLDRSTGRHGSPGRRAPSAESGTARAGRRRTALRAGRLRRWSRLRRPAGPARAHTDLIVLDQRGTGKSGLLRCSGWSASTAAPSPRPGSWPWRRGVRERAGAVGRTTPRSTRSRTSRRCARLSVSRPDAVRTSYGTKVAAAYAKRYPAQVDGLLLDSVVLPDADDPLARSTLAALPRVLDVLCAGGACARLGLTPLPDLRRLGAARRRVRPGHRVRRARSAAKDAPGRVGARADRRVRLDFDPVLRADTPAAVRAALRGDRAPLARAVLAGGRRRGRQAGRAERRPVRGARSARRPSSCGIAATPIPDRLAAARATVAAFPSATFDPFGAKAALNAGTGLCLRWPNAAAVPTLAPGPLPDVPALIPLRPRRLRTPLEDARTLAGQLPHARLVALAHVGHAVLFNDLSGCAQRRWTRSSVRRAAQLGARWSTHRPDAHAASAGRTRGRAARPAGPHGARRPAHAAGRRAAHRGLRRAGGLRGGYIAATLELADPARPRSCRACASACSRRSGPAHLSVAGPAASRAHLLVTRSGVVTGVVGGRHVHLVLARALSGGGRGWPARAETRGRVP